ncbi:hypothetical protein BK722_02780 [Bacillus thuringiensis serovar finitimus]|nr:hypothetical protein YBT020_28574 [Bacillus thuringiensis serovar finitimus YBT-020]OTX71524.1 hypothetical protein BK722_12100 [Bacillus thuringiensis serovar finitimus]OTY31852.1 hypothetical protein BK736_25580 [Bacillus thuringiensis serovar poloniensis]ADY25013.1 hypothetical protein YBT020_29296 [Bacillus thuringiensis serovar finitimus YBT-020]OTX71619.1 hypothetical protein BK722_11890 [Bacillus thuringiensis serovar finitimus]
MYQEWTQNVNSVCKLITMSALNVIAKYEKGIQKQVVEKLKGSIRILDFTRKNQDKKHKK